MDLNRRAFFRIEMYEQPATIYLSSNDSFPVFMKNISGNGLAFISPDILIFEEAKIEFQLEEKTYRWKIKLTRVGETGPNGNLYGVRFVDVDKAENKSMYMSMIRIDARRRLCRGKEKE